MEKRERHDGLLPRGRDVMLEPEEVDRILALSRKGWGSKRIARELGISRNTVRRYVEAGRWIPYRKRARTSKLAGLEEWLKESFFRHRGNCDVVRQELLNSHGIEVSLRTVERACRRWRAEQMAKARATVRFETVPGQQLQIDFGEATVVIAGKPERVHVFVATLGYSRLGYVAAFPHQRQSAWFAGLEGAFAHFGGVPREVLVANARALVTHHDRQTREVVFNERFKAFARHWGFTPKACAPFRARTKGKDERGVGYVKRNALAGHEFSSWAALEGHLAGWSREVADQRVHGTTGEAPRLRFERDERQALQPLAQRPPYERTREWVRSVNSEACIEVETNRYSVPWRLIGETVRVRRAEEELIILHGGQEVARHARLSGSRQRSIEAAHFAGLVGRVFRPVEPSPPEASCGEPTAGLLRPLVEYEALVGGGF